LFFGKDLFLRFEAEPLVVVPLDFKQLLEVVLAIQCPVVERERVQPHDVFADGASKAGFVVDFGVGLQFLHCIHLLFADGAVGRVGHGGAYLEEWEGGVVVNIFYIVVRVSLSSFFFAVEPKKKEREQSR